ncbi:MAG: hypothetical protein ACREFP_01470 [Acetobacteraceae bacterium]
MARIRRVFEPFPRVGSGTADAAVEAADRLFEAGETADYPGVRVMRSELAAGLPAFRPFSLAGLAGSNIEVRRPIPSGGARINDAPPTDDTRPCTLSGPQDSTIKLSARRPRHRLVRPD